METLQKLSIMAAAQGKSVKAFIENLLLAKAEAFCIEVSTTPSPSGDPYFADTTNLAEVEERVKTFNDGQKATVTLRSAEDIKNFINK